MASPCACGLCGLDAPAGRRYRHGHNRKLPPRYVVDPETGCWMWQGRVLASGYGQYKDRGRVFQAHVWFWEREHGPVPEELELDHTCHTADPDCPGGPTCPHHRCVNPDHLEAVTHIENVRRSRVAKLTVGDVREIKRLFREHEGATRAFAREIAPRYGVGPQAIRSLLSGETWADVEERAA